MDTANAMAKRGDDQDLFVTLEGDSNAAGGGSIERILWNNPKGLVRKHENT
jgi:hypothetical protein